MKPDNQKLEQPLDQADLEKLPKTTLSKNMKNIEDIMAEFIANGDANLTTNEARLLDRQVTEKTGKSLGKFKAKAKKPKNVDIVISADGDAKGQKDPVLVKTRARKDPPTVPGVVVNGAIS